MKLCFDVESDGLLDTITKIHCLVIQDVDTRKVQTFVGHTEIKKGLALLNDAKELVGHNILGYDIPAINKIFPNVLKKDLNVYDTLLAGKLYNPDIYGMDVAGYFKGLEKKNYGSYSLEAFGQRFGNHKAQKPTDFSVFTEEMLAYCIQDVDTNVTVYHRLKQLNISEKAYKIELDFWKNMLDMETAGFPFDVKAAQALYAKLAAEREKISRELVTLFPTRTIERLSEKTGKPLKPKVIEFNPSSRDHIAYWFKTKYDWQPKDFTPSGKAEINADILEELDYPEAAELKRYFILDKAIGTIAEGKNAWTTMVGDDGRMHGRINTIGAASTRCTHSNPNLGQVPSTRKPYGKECREFFRAEKGYKQVGADLNAIELRMFAHYLSAYDDGEYVKIIETSDIHWSNAVAAGFHPGGEYNSSDKEMKQARDNAKTLIYALLYSAGDPKLGEIVGGGKKEGVAIRTKLYKNFPAIEKLIAEVRAAAESRKSIKLLHGAVIPVRKAFAALNTLLQGGGAVINKAWVNKTRELCDAKGWVFGKDYWFAANIHDELQSMVKEDLAEEFAKLVESAAGLAGQDLGMRCPVKAEAQIGNNWADVH